MAPYEYYEPYVERMKAGQTAALLGPDQPLVMFALTSGTRTARKFIPITKEFVEHFRRGWMVWGMRTAEQHPGIMMGRVVHLTSDWAEFRTQAGIPCGSVSGLIANMQNPVIRRRYCVPPLVGRIKDVTARYYTTLRLAVEQDVSYMTTANPSTLVNLARLGDEEKENLLRDIADGRLSERFAVPKEIRNDLAPLVGRPNLRRARQLEQIVARTGHLLPKDYWPDLKMLANWTGGVVGAYIRHFPGLFGSATVRDIGLIASEGRMTIPIRSQTSAGVLDVLTNYYEFIPEDEAQSPDPTVLEAHELVEGRNYYIVLTTPSGFYRYNIFDVVRVVGWHNQAPMLEFLNKGAHVSSITGEKISESQVSRAVDRALGDLSMTLTAFTLAPCCDDRMPYYVLLIERSDTPTIGLAHALARRTDGELQRLNSEYQSKRQTKRLGPVLVGWLPAGTWRDFFSQSLKRSGGTAEQYKHPCLVSDLQFLSRMPVERMLHTGAAADQEPSRRSTPHSSQFSHYRPGTVVP